MIDREELERLHEAAGALDVVAWMYEWAGPNPKDVTQFRQIRPSGPLKQGWTETPLTDLNKANEIINTLAAENAALTEKVERLEESLTDGKRSLEVAIYGLPEMLEQNALSDEEGMVPALQAAVERMSAALTPKE